MGNWYEYDFSGRRILLVEDHPINACVAQRMLEMVGFQVVVAPDGQMGVEQYWKSDSGYFDAILMDINMPVMDGLTAAKKIRSLDTEEAATVPIIAMTTNGYEEDKLRSMQAGMNDHLVKPVDPDELLECLARYLRNGQVL